VPGNEELAKSKKLVSGDKYPVDITNQKVKKLEKHKLTTVTNTIKRG